MNIDFGDVDKITVVRTGTLFYGGGKRKMTSVGMSIKFDLRGSVFIHLNRKQAKKLSDELQRHLKER